MATSRIGILQSSVETDDSPYSNSPEKSTSQCNAPNVFHGIILLSKEPRALKDDFSVNSYPRSPSIACISFARIVEISGLTADRVYK
jgi:hypothetical protein